MDKPSPLPDGPTHTSLCVSTLPGTHRARVMHEYLAEMMRVDMALLDPGRPLHYRACTRVVPGAIWGNAYSSPVSVTRTQALCADGQSDLLLSMSTVPMTIELPGAGAMRAEPGDAVLLSQARPVRLIYQKAGPTWVLRVPHADVARMLPRLSAAPVLVLRKGTPMLQLLQSYGRLLHTEPLESIASQRLASRQLQEMLALTLSESLDFAEWAERHTLGDVRLQTLRADIAANLKLHTLSLEWAAARQGISPRSLQRLLAGKGTNWQDEVRTARLQAAYAMLKSPHCASLSISAIAQECGFSEASVLTRTFKQAFGLTPSEARASGMEQYAGGSPRIS